MRLPEPGIADWMDGCELGANGRLGKSIRLADSHSLLQNLTDRTVPDGPLQG
jgi:hypothetical protein